MNELLLSLGVADWVPAPLAGWRPLLIEGLAFFLERLPQQRQSDIVAAQLALPPDASAALRLVTLLTQCPTLHKLGQVVARHRQLHADLRRELQSLETMAPAAATAGLEHMIAGLPHDPALLVAAEALAEGSVALVIPFSYRLDGVACEGVFKALKPGVEQRLAQELSIWSALVVFLETRGSARGLPALDYRGTLESVSQLLAREVDLAGEQRNMAAAAAFYADQPAIRIPRLLPWCTPRVTAMERIHGVKLTDARLAAGQGRQLAHTLVAALLAKPFWSRSATSAFHADLHAGNLMLTGDGRIAVLDWSLATQLSLQQREALLAIVVGGLTLDAPRIQGAVARLGTVTAGDAKLAGTIERALDSVAFGGEFPGFRWLLKLLDELALTGCADFGEELMLLRKTWLSLAGVIGDLSEGASPELPLFGMGLQSFIAELPERVFAAADAVDYATPLSNADLLQSGIAAWLAPARYWTRLNLNLQKKLLMFAAGADPQTT